ncbi:MAG: hypothetical protein R3349_09930, partial [Geminicoccaceae bacterium]|nr:hypothetical protein [Geminicoccaceae bacterium]
AAERAAAAIDRLGQGDLRLVVAEPAQGAAGRRAGKLQVVVDGLVIPNPTVRTLGGWRGLAGPPGMSKKQAGRIAVAARLVTGGVAFRRFLGLRGYSPSDLGPDAFKSFLRTYAGAVADARTALD